MEDNLVAWVAVMMMMTMPMMMPMMIMTKLNQTRKPGKFRDRRGRSPLDMETGRGREDAMTFDHQLDAISLEVGLQSKAKTFCKC